MLTKDDIYAIRHANSICVHLSSQHPKGLVRLIKHKPYNAKPFEHDQEYILADVHVTLETIRGVDALERGDAKCSELVSQYPDQGCSVSSILRTLRVGDELTFSFYPDGHSNGYVANAGLHADILYLKVRRGDNRQKWELATSICADNSARMCRGVPNSRDYEAAAESFRKSA